MKPILETTTNPPAAQPAPLPEAQPRVAATAQLAVDLCHFAKVLDATDLKKLAKLDDAFRAALAEMKGYSYDDARALFKSALHDAINGKADDHEHFDDIKNRYSLKRRVVRAKASKISREACLIAAGIYEKALKSLPDFGKELLRQEQILNRGYQPENSPIKALIKDLERTMTVQIKSWRDNPNPMTRPAGILNL